MFFARCKTKVLKKNLRKECGGREKRAFLKSFFHRPDSFGFSWGQSLFYTQNSTEDLPVDVSFFEFKSALF